MPLVTTLPLVHFGVWQPHPVKKFLTSWIVNTLAVGVAVSVLPGLHFKNDSLWTPFITALVLGILNAFIRPLLMFFALPLLIVTLGLFTLVINALVLKLVGWLLSDSFAVDGFSSALLGAIIISIVSMVLNKMIGNTDTKPRSERKSAAKKAGPPSGSGPVIDV